MNYIISNERLSKLMSEYLDDRLKHGVSRIDSFIIIHGEDNEDPDFDNILIEYDRFDGRLYIYKDLIDTFSSIFPFGDDKLEKFIKFWFESKFEVEVKYIKISS